MHLTPEQREALVAQLAEAERAYHSLQIGVSARVVVDQNGERVEFSAANRQGLYAYIQQLKSQLGLLNPYCGVGPQAPAAFYF